MARAHKIRALRKAQRSALDAQHQIASRTRERTARLFAEQAATAQQVDAAERDEQTLSAQIRAPGVSEAASQLAADPGVREALVHKQRELLAHGDWVAEGRDIGSVVAREAELKLFLTASAQERARRRAAQLGADEGAVAAELSVRDSRDSARAHSPLAPAAGAPKGGA